MVYAQTSICPGNWDAQTPLGSWDTNGSPDIGQTNRHYNNQQEKKKRSCRIVNFAVPADHRVKLKESEKKDKYLDFSGEMNKLWNMKVMIIQIGTLGTITKCLIQGLEDIERRRRAQIIQTTALLRSARILRRILKTWGDLMSLKLQWKNIS